MRAPFAGLLLASILALVACGGNAPSANQPVRRHVDGTIQAMDGTTWLVGRELVELRPGTRVVGSPSLGADAAIDGTLGPAGQLLAASVQVFQPTPAPTATVLPTPIPTIQPVVREPDRQKGRGKHGENRGSDD